MHLAVREYIDLVIGPSDASPPFDRLHVLYHEHAYRFDSNSWAFKYFETGVDDRESMELDPDHEVGLPGVGL